MIIFQLELFNINTDNKISINNMNTKKVVCFGEVLWDNLPEGARPGGAPMNVGYHLQKLGVTSTLITAVGKDDSGAELIAALKDLGFDMTHCQRNILPTSTVNITTSADHEVHYEIVKPAAWDRIELTTNMITPVRQANYFIYGSLSGRNLISQLSLKTLRTLSAYNVLDLNFRDPYVDKDHTLDLLSNTGLLKLNVNELDLLASWMDTASADREQKIQEIFQQFPIKELILTAGDQGAWYYSKDKQYHTQALKVKVQDTVGSGDSFLAGFLAKRMEDQSIESAMDFAAQLSGYVTAQAGACPAYELSDVEEFAKNNRQA